MVDVARLQIEADSSQVKTAAGDLDRLSTSAGKAANSSDALNRTTISLSHVYRELAAVMGTLKFLDTIRQTIELNQRYKELGIAMEVVGRNVNLNSQQLNATTAALEKMGISMIEARQTVTRLAASHIDLANAEKLADLARNAAIVGQINTSEALDRIVHGIRSAEAEVLKTIGITVQFDQAYKQLAAQLGKTTNELTQQEKQQARVNVVLDQAPALVGLYEAAMNNAGKQFRSTERLAENLKIKIGELFDETTKLAVRSYTNLLKDLDNTFTELTDTGELQTWGDQLAYTFAFLGDAARVAVSPVIILLRTVDAAIERAKALASGDFAKSRQIGADFDEFLKGELKVITGSTALRDELRKQRVERDLLTSAVGRGAAAVQKETEEISDNTGSFKQSRDERKEFINALAKQAVEAGKSRIEIQRMEAALLGVSDAAEPYLRIIENQARAEEDLRISRQQQADDLRKIESITQSVRTKQEIYNDTVKELDDLLTKGLGINAYNRSLEKAREELNKTEKKTREFWDTNEQIWIQGVRNVQTSLANGLFNVFDDGLKGMVNGVKRAVGQMLAEFASIKILQSTGIAGLLGLGSTAAMASTGGGGGLSALSSISNIIGSGFGVSNLIGSGISGLGSLTGSGSLTAFGQAFTGDAIAGFAGQAGAFGASAGSAFSAVAGPAMIAFMATQGLKALVGDKRLGGGFGKALNAVGDIPIIGDMLPIVPILNGLFGRGAPKFQNEALVGNVSAGGFEGVLNQAFREKGGLARSDRVSNFIADTDTGNLLNQFGRLSESGNIPGALRDSASDPAVKRALEVGKLLDFTFTSISDSLQKTADLLGYSTESLQGFNAELDLVSKKGEQLSEEQISEEINRITEEMIKGVIPSIDLLSKHGEDAAATLVRLADQFQVLQQGVQLFGASADDAAAKVRTLSADEQTALVDRFGGSQKLGAELSQFYETVLNESQKMEIVEQQILDVLKTFEIDFVPSLKQVYEAVKSGNPDLIEAALAVDGLVSQFKEMSDAARDAHIAEMNKINSERFGLETKLLSLQGNALELRKLELQQIDPSNRALQARIWLLEDEKNEMQALAKERRAFTAGRRDAQEGRLPDPTIATTIGGKIFTEAEIRAMQQTAVDEATSSLQNIVREQLNRLGESYRDAQSFVRDQIDAVKEANKFFDGLKNDFLEISTSSRAAAHEQLNAALELTKSGADISLIDTPELANAIRTLKDDRTDLFSTREAFEMDRASAVNKILELSRLGVTHSDETLNTLKEQLDVMKSSFEVQEQLLNAQLRFSGVNDASLLSDSELTGSASGAFKSLIENLAIQAGTSFNGSVRFPDPRPGGDFDAIKNMFTSQFNSLIPTTGTSFNFSDMAQALKEMKDELAKIKTSSEKTASVLSTVTRDGRAMQTA